MADIRFKDLTTTASSTASDDFIAVDGTTNGTRKLSAFSPTFGGNATVTGTLTVNGTGNSSFAGQLIQVADPATISLWKDATPTKAARFQFNTLADNGFSLGVYDGSSWFNAITVAPTTGVVKVPSTSASTTTSSGALVVGNGTSGGLGVGGAASIGGPILVGTSSDVYVSRVATGILDIRSASSPGTTARLDVTGTTSAGVGFRQSGTRDWFISAESAELRVTCGTSGSIFAVTNGNPVALRDTTASTSTSSGALVVSGGVGVGGNLSIGGDVLIDKSAIEVLLKRSANTNDGLIKFQTGIFGDFGIGHRGTSDSDLHIYNYGTAADALKIAKNDSLATFAAAIRTAAPSGGTAANWKLGTVASVSPTSPNRTIEVDIGGTIYYIHAKTTNN